MDKDEAKVGIMGAIREGQRRARERCMEQGKEGISEERAKEIKEYI